MLCVWHFRSFGLLLDMKITLNNWLGFNHQKLCDLDNEWRLKTFQCLLDKELQPCSSCAIWLSCIGQYVIEWLVIYN